MDNQEHKFWVEVGGYAGENRSGAWSSRSENQFYQTVQAPSATIAESMIINQYGGLDNCRVNLIGTIN